jgi:type VI secretion system protein ImpA
MPDSPNGLSLAELSAPINGGPGEDLSFSALFDEIKEARRADPHYLTQGDWQTDLKSSDWDLTVTLAAQGLAQQSKDLMLAAWLSEGLAHTRQFAGITFGHSLMQRILEDFWPGLFPAQVDGLEERAARLAWLNTTLAEVVGELPITQGQPFGLLRYEESRYVENLALQNPKAMQAALDEGKINAEIFQRSVALTPSEHLRLKATEIAACLEGCEQLQNVIDTLFASEAPSFAALADILLRTALLAERLLRERGLEPNLTRKAASSAGSDSATAPSADIVLEHGPHSSSPAPLRTTPATRDEAFTLLANTAQFFKNTEPHSPVPYLIERAIKWGNMPLEGWLNDVIKDTTVVDNIRELLGTG